MRSKYNIRVVKFRQIFTQWIIFYLCLIMRFHVIVHSKKGFISEKKILFESTEGTNFYILAKKSVQTKGISPYFKQPLFLFYFVIRVIKLEILSGNSLIEVG